ncbi:hypothetical protein EVAR_8141_1 [Eumeta japonica]|uniref:Uncharacterized protein n=1 Tax=Eumeta variegata TaxID=151549 RepID=A0A4C1TSU8_EUMVA|nr:hypothetical protein EVAR_8141_1 [Eumeta japonica]
MSVRKGNSENSFSCTGSTARHLGAVPCSTKLCAVSTGWDSAKGGAGADGVFVGTCAAGPPSATNICPPFRNRTAQRTPPIQRILHPHSVYLSAATSKGGDKKYYVNVISEHYSQLP